MGGIGRELVALVTPAGVHQATNKSTNKSTSKSTKKSNLISPRGMLDRRIPD